MDSATVMLKSKKEKWSKKNIPLLLCSNVHSVVKKFSQDAEWCIHIGIKPKLLYLRGVLMTDLHILW